MNRYATRALFRAKQHLTATRRSLRCHYLVPSLGFEPRRLSAAGFEPTVSANSNHEGTGAAPRIRTGNLVLTKHLLCR